LEALGETENAMQIPIPKVEWPQRTCRDAVWGKHQAYTCELPDLHLGPCASQSVADSLRRREVWEQAHQDQREDQQA
jgi:hypothetical protein